MSSIEEKNLRIDRNLKENDVAISVVLEKRAAHILEKADLVRENDPETVRSDYENVFGKKKRELGCIKENERYIKAVCSSIEVYDVLNCIDQSEVKQSRIFDADGEAEFSTDSVVYLKNPLTDLAYNAFSALMTDPRALYEDTFSEVCEEIYYSRSPYCILPIENSEEGRLSGFGNLIRKYELKIVATCSVESAGGKTTRFALLKRSLERIKCPERLADGEYLEIGFNFGEEQRLADVLYAAEFFGYRLNKIDSTPMYYSEKEYYYDTVFKGSGELNKFLFWLELEVPRYEVIGIYTHLKSKKGKNGG